MGTVRYYLWALAVRGVGLPMDTVAKLEALVSSCSEELLKTASVNSDTLICRNATEAPVGVVAVINLLRSMFCVLALSWTW